MLGIMFRSHTDGTDGVDSSQGGQNSVENDIPPASHSLHNMFLAQDDGKKTLLVILTTNEIDGERAEHSVMFLDCYYQHGSACSRRT